MTRLLLLFSLFQLSIFEAQTAKALEFPPAPKDYVFDETETLNIADRQTLYRLALQEDQRGGNQVLVAVFNSLGDEDPVDFTNRLFKHWNPGQKGKNNGVILAFYMKERKIRIEVGYGLEPVLTDARTRRIIEDEIVPLFKVKQMSRGIQAGMAATIQAIADPSAVPPPRKRGTRLTSSAFFIIVFILFMLLRGFSRVTSLSSRGQSTLYRGRRGLLSGLLIGSSLPSGRSSGGWGGGGFGGGGGFSGGGGMSGGGGSSGSW